MESIEQANYAVAAIVGLIFVVYMAHGASQVDWTKED